MVADQSRRNKLPPGKRWSQASQDGQDGVRMESGQDRDRTGPGCVQDGALRSLSQGKLQGAADREAGGAAKALRLFQRQKVLIKVLTVAMVMMMMMMLLLLLLRWTENHVRGTMAWLGGRDCYPFEHVRP